MLQNPSLRCTMIWGLPRRSLKLLQHQRRGDGSRYSRLTSSSLVHITHCAMSLKCVTNVCNCNRAGDSPTNSRRHSPCSSPIFSTFQYHFNFILRCLTYCSSESMFDCFSIRSGGPRLHGISTISLQNITLHAVLYTSVQIRKYP